MQNVIKLWTKKNNVEKISHEVYATADTWTDAMFLIHLRCEQAVFSHESALYFHDLTDREPSPYSITVALKFFPHET